MGVAFLICRVPSHLTHLVQTFRYFSLTCTKISGVKPPLDHGPHLMITPWSDRKSGLGPDRTESWFGLFLVWKDYSRRFIFLDLLTGITRIVKGPNWCHTHADNKPTKCRQHEKRSNLVRTFRCESPLKQPPLSIEIYLSLCLLPPSLSEVSPDVSLMW